MQSLCSAISPRWRSGRSRRWSSRTRTRTLGRGRPQERSLILPSSLLPPPPPPPPPRCRRARARPPPPPPPPLGGGGGAGGGGGHSSPINQQRALVNLVHHHGRVNPALRHGEDVLGHRVTRRQRGRAQPGLFKALQKHLVALPVHRLGAIDDGPPRGEVHAFEIAVARLLRAEVVGEVGQPRKRSVVARHGLHQPGGRAHP